MSESFESAIKTMRENLTGMYDNGHMTAWADVDTSVDLDRLQKAHEHDMELADKAAYHRGHEDGRRSMDAEHYAVALRLHRLRFDGGSHENLNKIAYAIYPCATGWTCESCDGLRDELIRLMGGCVGDNASNSMHFTTTDTTTVTTKAGDLRLDNDLPISAIVGYDVLGNERHKAVCALRKLPLGIYGGGDVGWWQWFGELADAIGVKADDPEAPSIGELYSRLIHLLGGDQSDDTSPMGQEDGTGNETDGACSNTVQSPSITDELREWYRTTPYLGKGGFELHEIAGHIDSEFARLLKQKDDAWQATCEHVSDECDAECQMYRDMLNDAAREFRDLVAEHECCREERDAYMCDLFDSSVPATDENMARYGWIRLPTDADGEYIHVGDMVTCNNKYEKLEGVHRVQGLSLHRIGGIGWCVRLYDSWYEPDELNHHHEPDPIESLVTQHTLGNLDAQELIEKLREVVDDTR